jgi:hypothetical protein
VLAKLAAAAVLAAAPAAAQDLGERAEFKGSKTFFTFVAPQAGGVVFETGESASIPNPWDAILFQGESPDTAVSFEAARELPGGGWSAWLPARVKRTADGRFWGRTIFPVRAAGKLKIRALDGGAAGPHAIQIYGVEVYTASDREVSAAGSAPVKTGDAVRPPVRLRAEWKAGPPKEAYTPHAPYRLTLHHTDGRQTATVEESLREIKFIQDFHQNGRGWNDIAYHYLIDTAGNVFEGRPDDVLGSHTKNNNTGNVGIVMLGTYHAPKNDPVTRVQLDAFLGIAGYLVNKFGINPDTLKGHRQYKSTDCPGDLMFAELPALREALKPKPGPVPPAKVIMLPALKLPRFD